MIFFSENSPIWDEILRDGKKVEAELKKALGNNRSSDALKRGGANKKAPPVEKRKSGKLSKNFHVSLELMNRVIAFRVNMLWGRERVEAGEFVTASSVSTDVVVVNGFQQLVVRKKLFKKIVRTKKVML